MGLKEYYIECKRIGDEGHYPTVKFDHIDSELFSPYGFLIGFKTPTFFATYKKRDVFVKLVDRGSIEFALWCEFSRSENESRSLTAPTAGATVNGRNWVSIRRRLMCFGIPR